MTKVVKTQKLKWKSLPDLGTFLGTFGIWRSSAVEEQSLNLECVAEGFILYASSKFFTSEKQTNKHFLKLKIGQNRV